MPFLEWKRLNFRLKRKVSDGLLEWWSVSVGSGGGLVPSRQQATSLTINGRISWCLYALMDLSQLRCWAQGDVVVFPKCVNFEHNLGIDTLSVQVTIDWMPGDLVDDKLKLDQVTAWCHPETSHYLSQCWPRSMAPYQATVSCPSAEMVLSHWPLGDLNEIWDK